MIKIFKSVGESKSGFKCAGEHILPGNFLHFPIPYSPAWSIANLFMPHPVWAEKTAM